VSSYIILRTDSKIPFQANYLYLEKHFDESTEIKYMDVCFIGNEAMK
jgi:hypothetical protein